MYNGVKIFHTKDSEAQIMFMTKETFNMFSYAIAQNTTSKTVFNPLDICPFFNDDDFQEAWVEWHNTPKMKKVSKSDRAIKRKLNKLMKFSSGVKGLAVKLIERSADKGYTDIYEPQDKPRVNISDGVTSKAMYDRQSPEDIKREMGIN
jgi:hypothetical protein